MRQIKFRAWDKEKKQMVGVEGVFPYQDRTTKGGEVFFTDDTGVSKYFPEEVELMQFTGYVDFEGREIYEGDIMTWPENESGVWADQAGKVIEVKFPFICGNTYKGKVVGNIHENPELLKATK
jgi:uncharacterized phage protein (TIGR01671 family)